MCLRPFRSVRMSVRTSFVVNDVRAFFVLGVATGFPLVFAFFFRSREGGTLANFLKMVLFGRLSLQFCLESRSRSRLLSLRAVGLGQDIC